jgi:hypothetical protein
MYAVLATQSANCVAIASFIRIENVVMLSLRIVHAADRAGVQAYIPLDFVAEQFRQLRKLPATARQEQPIVEIPIAGSPCRRVFRRSARQSIEIGKNLTDGRDVLFCSRDPREVAGPLFENHPHIKDFLDLVDVQ